MANQHFRTQFEPLEPRALLSQFILGTTTESARTSNGKGAALVGSIEGTETFTTQGYQFVGTGTVQPLGGVSVTGVLKLKSQGTLKFSNTQGSVTLSMKYRGYFLLGAQDPFGEESRATVQVRSATGS
jgi:hypothetical protein